MGGFSFRDPRPSGFLEGFFSEAQNIKREGIAKRESELEEELIKARLGEIKSARKRQEVLDEVADLERQIKAAEGQPEEEITKMLGGRIVEGRRGVRYRPRSEEELFASAEKIEEMKGAAAAEKRQVPLGPVADVINEYFDKPILNRDDIVDQSAITALIQVAGGISRADQARILEKLKQQGRVQVIGKEAEADIGLEQEKQLGRASLESQKQEGRVALQVMKGENRIKIARLKAAADQMKAGDSKRGARTIVAKLKSLALGTKEAPGFLIGAEPGIVTTVKGGFTKKVTAKAGYAQQEKLYIDNLTGGIAILARAMGHKGNLSDTDTTTTMQLFALPGDSEEMGRAKFEFVEEILAGDRNSILRARSMFGDRPSDFWEPLEGPEGQPGQEGQTFEWDQLTDEQKEKVLQSLGR